MSKCAVCKNEHTIIAQSLGVCKECIIKKKPNVEKFIFQAHKNARERFNLPAEPPKAEYSSCILCAHHCGLQDNNVSYCGLRYSKDGTVISLVSTKVGLLEYYFDPLPCNCCAAWFCPAGTGAGYPQFAYRNGPEYRYYNLSVFFYGCSFDCLYCQNYHHKNIKLGNKVSKSELLEAYKSNIRTSCVCFFGGSPEPHFSFALAVSKSIYEYAQKHNRIARICWEWNGYGNTRLVKRAAEISLISGGNIKFDLKAFNSNLHKALTGVDNKVVLKNFELVAKEYFDQRPDLPILNATTLLVPGYIDEEEIEKIAEFIANLNDEIPYSLLGFAPQHEMIDLPYTSRELAERCYKVAKRHLKNVNIGNKHILV